jgi:xanthine/CO dehydrogenase XdhC/CoxF family maturation factor
MSSSRRHDCWCSARSISLRRWCCSGAFLDYRATACDALGVFTTAARIPTANEVVVNWPHRYLAAEAAAGRVDRRTVVTVLTHDPKFDVPCSMEGCDSTSHTTGRWGGGAPKTTAWPASAKPA